MLLIGEGGKGCYGESTRLLLETIMDTLHNHQITLGPKSDNKNLLARATYGILFVQKCTRSLGKGTRSSAGRRVGRGTLRGVREEVVYHLLDEDRESRRHP